MKQQDTTNNTKMTTSVSSSRCHRSRLRINTWWLACAILLLLQENYFLTAYGLCSSNSSFATTNNTNCSTPQENLTKYNQLWIDQGALDYSYTFKQTCECFHTDEPFNTTIVDLLVVVDPSVRLPRDFELPTIPSLFQRIQDYITEEAYSVQVTYDEDYGYPTYIYIDRHELVMDDEYIVYIEDLQITRTVSSDTGSASDVDPSVTNEINAATSPPAYRPSSKHKRKRLFRSSTLYQFFFGKQTTP
mmetsp:Transcript_7334/g.9498  ORF Transcript_7334/g.9498 Transcript_7334/m.9498 type:complete len:246 (+) Transcript_7334:46-783(+)